MIKNIKLTDFILQFKNIYFICSSTSSPLPNKAELPTQNVSKETKRKLNGASAKFAACNCRLCPEQQQTCNVQQQKKKTKKKRTSPILSQYTHGKTWKMSVASIECKILRTLSGGPFAMTKSDSHGPVRENMRSKAAFEFFMHHRAKSIFQNIRAIEMGVEK